MFRLKKKRFYFKVSTVYLNFILKMAENYPKWDTFCVKFVGSS